MSATKPRGTLPITRVHTIMKSSSDAEQISKESAQTMSKAAEMFIKLLSEDGYKLTNNGRKLDYDHLAQVVHSDERYEFLREMMPKKITVLEYKRILARQERQKEDEEEDEEDSESEGGSTTGTTDESD